MPGCLQYDHLAIRNTAIDVLTNFLARDDILAALKYERGNIDACQVASIVSREGNPRKGLGDFRVGSAELLVSSSPSSGRSGLPMIAGAICADQPI